MSANVRTASLILAAGALIAAFGAGNRWEWAMALAALGLVAGIGPRWPGVRLGTFWLATCVIAAGAGMMIGLPPLPLLVAVSAALAVWDLDAFLYRLARVDRTDLTRRLEKAHLLRLLSVLVLGMAASILALSIRIELSLIWAMVLVLVIVISLRMGIGALMRVTPAGPPNK